MGLIEHVPVLAHQAELLASRARTKCGPGGLGSGKTRTLCYAMLDLGQANAPYPGMIVEPTFAEIRDVIVPEMEEIGEEWGFHVTHSKEAQRLRVDLGDGVRFDVFMRSGDRPRSVVGVNASYVLIDEAGLQKDELVRKAMARARHPKAPRKEVWLVGTPEGLTGEFYDLCENGGPDARHLVRACTLDNFLLDPSPEEYVRERLGRFSEHDLQQYVRGLFVARHGTVYNFYDQTRHERPCPDRLEGDLVLLGDFGRNTMPWGFGRILPRDDGEEHLHIWGEVVGRQTDTFKQIETTKRYLTNVFAEHYGEELDFEREIAPRFTVYCDAAGGHKQGSTATETDHELLMGAGFHVDAPTRNPPIMDRVYTVQHRLRSGLLHVDPERAPYLARCLRLHAYDATGMPLKVKDDGTGPPGLDHGADAIGYGCHRRWEYAAPRGNLGHSTL